MAPFYKGNTFKSIMRTSKIQYNVPEMLSTMGSSPSMEVNNVFSTKILVQPKPIPLSRKFQEFSYTLKDLLIDGYFKKIYLAISLLNFIKKDILSLGINLKSMKKKKALGITTNIETYDILKDLDVIQPSIIMKQLLAVAPKCCSILNSLLIRHGPVVEKFVKLV